MSLKGKGGEEGSKQHDPQDRVASGNRRRVFTYLQLAQEFVSSRGGLGRSLLSTLHFCKSVKKGNKMGTYGFLI